MVSSLAHHYHDLDGHCSFSYFHTHNRKDQVRTTALLLKDLILKTQIQYEYSKIFVFSIIKEFLFFSSFRQFHNVTQIIYDIMIYLENNSKQNFIFGIFYKSIIQSEYKIFLDQLCSSITNNMFAASIDVNSANRNRKQQQIVHISTVTQLTSSLPSRKTRHGQRKTENQIETDIDRTRKDFYDVRTTNIVLSEETVGNFLGSLNILLAVTVYDFFYPV